MIHSTICDAKPAKVGVGQAFQPDRSANGRVGLPCQAGKPDLLAACSLPVGGLKTGNARCYRTNAGRGTARPDRRRHRLIERHRTGDCFGIRDGRCGLSDSCRRNRDGAESVAQRFAGSDDEPMCCWPILRNRPTGPFAGQAWQWQGKVDIWINNAGADTLTGEAAMDFEQKLDALWQSIRGDDTAVALIGAKMKARGSGTILNMGWDQAEHGMAGDSGEFFAAVKGAVMAFTRSFARSLAPEVRVNCLAPGWIKTKWGNQASANGKRRSANRYSAAGERPGRFPRRPLPRFTGGSVHQWSNRRGQRR